MLSAAGIPHRTKAQTFAYTCAHTHTGEHEPQGSYDQRETEFLAFIFLPCLHEVGECGTYSIMSRLGQSAQFMPLCSHSEHLYINCKCGTELARGAIETNGAVGSLHVRFCRKVFSNSPLGHRSACLSVCGDTSISFRKFIHILEPANGDILACEFGLLLSLMIT